MRSLYDEISSAQTSNLLEQVLLPWIELNNYREEIERIADLISDGGQVTLLQEDIWELYALSRVLDVLTLGFQPQETRIDHANWAPAITIEEYTAFNLALGLTLLTPERFHPFCCEIVTAKPGNKSFEQLELYYPAVKLKTLMIKRAGTAIALEPSAFDINKVNAAPLYWTFRRRNRDCHDLSHGWGSNSQWRTDLRLDIEMNDRYIYNANRPLDLNLNHPETINELKEQRLTREEAIELTRYRQLLRTGIDDNDLWVYDFKVAEGK